MGKILALDIGEKKVGLAITDEGKFFAFPRGVVDPGKLLSELDNIIQSEQIEKIVIGLPRNMDGSVGFQAEEVKKFVEKNLDKHKEMIEYEDESATTLEAEEVMKREGKDPHKNKEELDAYAAKVILESYLRR